MIFREDNIRYIFITMFGIVFTLAYVWQNVEIMKIKLEYQKTIKEENELLKKNDKLKYQIEKYKRMESVEEAASRLGMRELVLNDFVTLTMKPVEMINVDKK